MDYVFQYLETDERNMLDCFNENEFKIFNILKKDDGLMELTVGYIGTNSDFIKHKNDNYYSEYDKYMKSIYDSKICKLINLNEKGFRVINPNCSDINNYLVTEINKNFEKSFGSKKVNNETQSFCNIL